MINIRLVITISILSLIIMAGVTLAASSDNYDLPFSADSGGGDDRASTNYALIDTAGQSTAIGVSNSASYRLESGFIPMLRSVYTEPEPPPVGGGTVELPAITDSDEMPWEMIAGVIVGAGIIGVLGFRMLRRKQTQSS